MEAPCWLETPGRDSIIVPASVSRGRSLLRPLSPLCPCTPAGRAKLSDIGGKWPVNPTPRTPDCAAPRRRAAAASQTHWDDSRRCPVQTEVHSSQASEHLQEFGVPRQLCSDPGLVLPLSFYELYPRSFPHFGGF